MPDDKRHAPTLRDELHDKVEMPKRASMVFAVVALASVAGCGSIDESGGGEQDAGGGGDTAIVDSGTDARVDWTDARVDSPGDTRGDATDGGGDSTDAGSDSIVDAPIDSTDAGSDSIVDAPIDSTAETSSDAPMDVGCGTLGAHPTDVFVDKRATTASVGTSTCPFHTIAEATTAALVPPSGSAMTIHVAVGTVKAPLIYGESGLEVRSGVTLLGDAAGTVLINGTGGSCIGGNCTLQIDEGGIVDGFLISGDGVVTVTTTTGKATIRNSLVNGATADGITINGNADLGPGIRVNGNGANGVTIAAGTVHVIAPTLVSAVNTFDSNPKAGIVVGGTDSVLVFDGGDVSTNAEDGIVLDNAPSAISTPSHTISNATVKQNGHTLTTDNGHSGIVVGANAGLVLRNSVVTKNGGHGVFWTRSTSFGSKLDLGTVAASGGNTFGGATSANQNAKSGVCIMSAPDTFSAVGDKWAACPPVASLVSDCTATFPYAVIAYKNTAAALVVTTTPSPSVRDLATLHRRSVISPEWDAPNGQPEPSDSGFCREKRVNRSDKSIAAAAENPASDERRVIFRRQNMNRNRDRFTNVLAVIHGSGIVEMLQRAMT
jgi:hypothetical protein